MLDTNHFSELLHGTELGDRLAERFDQHGDDVFTSVVTAQEITEGWSAFIRKQKAGSPKQVHGYQQFQNSLSLLMELPMLPFDDDAALIFRQLRKDHPRAGSQDLKIAAIALAHDALLLTRNLRDFSFVPKLRAENWLD